MAAESSRSSSSADSYIGSLISLTSKSEIRYEGILYNINTEESSIGLRNVRSFGTEGRKKDGPQVGPSDKVYEYILFRGSDIKDLQVKSSPPVQSTPAPPINSDPAIIQSHYPRPATTTSSLPAAASGSLTDISSHTAQLGHPGSTFQGGLPLYQPGGNLGSWGPSPPPPNANGSGLAMPMYWPGFYGPSTGLPQLHQQSLLRPPPGLSIPPMQQPMQYPGFNASLPAGALNLSTSNLTTPNLPTSNLPTSNFPSSNLPTSNLPEYPSPLLPATGSSAILTSTSFPGSSLPSSLPPVPPLSLPSETLPSLMTNKAPSGVGSTVPLGGSLPSLSPPAPELNAIVPPMSNKPNVISGPALPYQVISHPVSSIVGTTESPTPSLVTPGQLLHSGQGTVLPSQSSQVAHKDVEVFQIAPTPSSEPLAPVPVPTEAQPPILPLPTQSRPVQKMNGAPYQNRHGYRGRERGRGTGTSRPVMKFTEEFDFTAMNEKFNKDEVWGHLGKSNKSNSKDKGDGDGDVTDEEEYEDEDDAELPKFDVKPVYTKDDFFDSLSCNALDNHSNNGRTRFSEQMKLDTETFGEFSRYRGRGGRGPYRGVGRGPYRGGSYYGRGYGYNGRGRGGRTPNRDY